MIESKYVAYGESDVGYHRVLELSGQILKELNCVIVLIISRYVIVRALDVKLKVSTSFLTQLQAPINIII